MSNLETNIRQLIEAGLADHEKVLHAMRAFHVATIEKMADIVVSTLSGGRRIYLCGNGGSASDAQHIAAELIGRFKCERHPLPAIALTTDTSALTAIGNDYGYEEVFSRQVAGLMVTGDLLIVISTSGNSANVIRAAKCAREKGGAVIGWLGKDGGRLKELVDVALIVPSDDTARIQEMHITVGHILCAIVDYRIAPT